MEIGRTIKELRKKKNLSQMEFRKLCGLSQTSLSQIENGITRPSRRNLIKICDALGIPEHLLYLMSIEESDVTDSKKEAFKVLFPTVKDLLLKLFYDDSNPILTEK